MEFFTQPWPWYVTGPLLGLMVPVLLLAGNKHFGISSTMRHICAACIPTNLGFFKYDWKKEMWNLVLTLGLIIGAFIAANFLQNNDPINISAESEKMFSKWGLQYKVEQKIEFSYMKDGTCEAKDISEKKKIIAPSEIFNWNAFSSYGGWIFIALGGFLVGFGTRWANGCTSGHAIMGLSLLNFGSLIAVIGFFIGGLAVSHFLLPYLF